MPGCSYIPAPEDTVAGIDIDLFYERTGMLDGWDVARVNRLTRLLSCTIHELGKLCALTHKEMNRYIAADRFPPTVCLHFALIEDWAKQQRKGAKTEAAMPVHLFKNRN